jgi:pimeloyl-ACP methyl ester carboxylesterase
MVDYDIRDRAAEIDTSQVGVHIFNGEYDYSGTVEAGLAAHHAIAGSTHTEMPGMGHFPMQENPTEFAGYLLPVLDKIRANT